MKKLIHFLTLFITVYCYGQITVSTFTGSGSTGSTNGTGIAASHNQPNAIVRASNGDFYVGELNGSVIRRITPAGVVTTFAGSGTSGSANGTGTAAQFAGVGALAFDSNGNLYASDVFNYKIRKITSSGVVTDFAGSGSLGGADGVGSAASFQQTTGIAVSAANTLYVADGNRIRAIAPNGAVTTLAGSGVASSNNGIGTAATFNGITGIVIDSAGDLFVCESGGNRIRKVVITTGVVTTVAGSGTGGNTDGTGTSATFRSLANITIDNQNNLYVSNWGSNPSDFHLIRKITPSGVVTTIAGGAQGFANGAANVAQFAQPDGMCFDNNGTLYVADVFNNRIRSLSNVVVAPQVPLISGVSSSNITNTGARINFSINPNGNPATAVVRYGLTSSNLNLSESTGAIASTTSTFLNLTFLNPGTTYFYKVEASSSSGSATPSSTLSFITTAPVTTPPAITNVTASNITFNAATINFNLNAFGSATTYVVEYTTDVLAPWQTQNGGTTSVNTSTPFQVQLTNLIPNRRYFVRIRATNATSQVTLSSEIQFDTLRAIVLTNVNDSNVTATTAQINYTLNTNGFSTFVEVKYQAGTLFDTDNPFTTVTINTALTNNAATNYNYTITGLTPNTTYSYRIGAAAATVGGAEDGENAGFTTTAAQSATPTATTPQTFCNGATVANLVATGTDLKWYANASGGSQLASTTLLTPTTYYVTQTQPNLTESARLAVGANITVVNAPTASAQSFCNSATVANLVATGSGLKWYSAATGGTQLAATTALATSNYFVSQTIGTCESTRTSVAVTVTVVNAPTASAQSFCTSATVANLVATGTDLKWYAGATGGTQLAATTALATSNYFVSQTIGTCESTRTSVAVTVTVVNAPTASAQSFCNSATVANLVATGSDLKWYAAATGGTQLAATTALATSNYFVSQTIGTCESTRTSVAVTVTVVNAPTASAQSFCNSATVANLVATATDLKWYSAATGGTQLAATTALATGTYFVSQTIGTCESTRTSVAVTVTVVNAPTASAQSFCNSATVANLVATGSDLKWYAAATGGTQLASTTALATGNYFVSQTIGTCESTRTSVAVTVTVVNAPTGSTSQSFVTGQTVANLVATGTNIVWFSSSANANTNTNPLTANTILVTNTTYFAMQTVNGCRSNSSLAVLVTVNLSTTDFDTNLKVSIYPNPATEILNIEMDSDLLTAEIFSLHGQKIQTANTKVIQINNLSSGIYFVRIKDVDGKIATKKLIKK